MNFTDQEKQTIEAAKSNLKKANVIRIIAVSVMFIALTLYALNVLPQQTLLAALVVIGVVALLAPNLGFGPKYDELVLILQKKLEETERH